jgi:hypothetical protein
VFRAPNALPANTTGNLNTVGGTTTNGNAFGTTPGATTGTPDPFNNGRLNTNRGPANNNSVINNPPANQAAPNRTGERNFPLQIPPVPQVNPGVR